MWSIFVEYCAIVVLSVVFVFYVGFVIYLGLYVCDCECKRF
jgi:hypothetical protein